MEILVMEILLIGRTAKKTARVDLMLEKIK